MVERIIAIKKHVIDSGKKIPDILRDLRERLGSEFEHAINYANRSDFLFLREEQSAKQHFYTDSYIVIGTLFVVLWLYLVSLASVLNISVFMVVSAIIAVVYFILMVFKIWVVYNALNADALEITSADTRTLSDNELPMYSIIIPLLYEADVIPQIAEAMLAIDYPHDKLDIIITLEEYDMETRAAIKAVKLPKHFRTLILPDVKPKTKPKALNVAFLEARGEFVVIYDAEIVPEPDQLRKAVAAFRKYEGIGCLQTKLDHYNARQNIITRLFNAEFAFHYDLFLPGLERCGYPIALSGHSTHFRSEVIRAIGAWDPYNVTEDCEIGIRLHRLGFKTAVLNSTSFEEATPTFESWVKQRTRWMKGFLQTGIVHLRHPFSFYKEIGGFVNMMVFIALIPGAVVINVLNLIYWIILGLWLVTGAEWIQHLFPYPVLLLSLMSFLVGNFIFTYLNLLGAFKRGRFDLVKTGILSPLYWILLAAASTRAAWQVVWNPHNWEKTKHGTHIQSGKHFIIQSE